MSSRLATVALLAALSPASASRPADEAAPLKAKVLKTDARGCTWLESEGLVTVGEDDTRHQARAAAVDEARRSAMQDFLGVKVRSRLLDFQEEGLRGQQSLTESLLLTTRQGRIIDEKVIGEGYRDLPDCPGCRYAVKVRTCILPERESDDKDFEVELGLSRSRLVAGDEVKLTVTSSRDCYLYVYNVWLDWKRTSLLVPNEREPEVFLKAGGTWEYPGLVGTLPEGRSVSAETIRLVATKTPLPAKVADPSGGFLAVLRRLNAARADWAEDAQAFTIHAK